MTSPERPAVILRAAACLGLGAAIAAMPLSLAGCKPETKPVVVEEPPAPPPPPPPAPKFTPIETLMAQLNIDSRVRLPENKAPDNDAARRAVLQFFDAMVRGDAGSLAGMLADPDRNELERMQQDGTWERATTGISRVDILTGQADNGLGQTRQVALALFYTGPSFQPQLWTYETALTPEFSAEPTPPDIVNRLSGEDWIAAWYKVLEDELAKAEEPDEIIVIKSVNKDTQASEAGGDGETPTGLPKRRGGGGGVPGRRPAGDPIDPPGLQPGGN